MFGILIPSASAVEGLAFGGLVLAHLLLAIIVFPVAFVQVKTFARILVVHGITCLLLAVPTGRAKSVDKTR